MSAGRWVLEFLGGAAPACLLYAVGLSQGRAQARHRILTELEATERKIASGELKPAKFDPRGAGAGKPREGEDYLLWRGSICGAREMQASAINTRAR